MDPDGVDLAPDRVDPDPDGVDPDPDPTFKKKPDQDLPRKNWIRIEPSINNPDPNPI